MLAKGINDKLKTKRDNKWITLNNAEELAGDTGSEKINKSVAEKNIIDDTQNQ